MRKKLRRLMTTFLALMMAVSVCPEIPAKAAEESYCWPSSAPLSSNSITQYVNGIHYGIDISSAEDKDYNIYSTKSGKIIQLYSGCKNSSGLKTGRCYEKNICNPNIGIVTADKYKNSLSYHICNWGYGNGLVIEHDDGTVAMYAHMLSITDGLKIGSTVKAGDLLGKMGSTGASEGRHLHFELAKNRAAVESGSYYGNSHTSGNYIINPATQKYYSNGNSSGSSSNNNNSNNNRKSAIVTFNPCSGKVSLSTKVVAYEGTYGILPTPERDGYNFEGWYRYKVLTTYTGKVTSDTKVTSKSNHTLYAKWTKAPTGQIKIKLDNIINNVYKEGYIYNQSFAGGYQCYGFAKDIVYRLFGKSTVKGMTYRSWLYNGTSGSGMKTVGTLKKGNYTAAKMKALISKAKPGDVLQLDVGTKNYQHSMIIYSVGTDSFKVYDANGKIGGKANEVALQTKPYNYYQNYDNARITLLHSDNYETMDRTASNGTTIENDTSTKKPNVKFAVATDKTYKARIYTNTTSAGVCMKITKPSDTTCTRLGIRIYDAYNNLLKDQSFNVNVAKSGTSFHTWYDIKKNGEVNLDLTPGTTYYYVMYGTFNNYTCESSKQSFTTKKDTSANATSNSLKVTFTAPTDSTYVNKKYIKTDAACVCYKISKKSGVSVSKMGIRLYDSNGNLLKDKVYNVNNVSKNGTYFHTWFEIYKGSSEIDVELKPGTTYSYVMYGVFNNQTIESEKATFTTLGGATASFVTNPYADVFTSMVGAVLPTENTTPKVNVTFSEPTSQTYKKKQYVSDTNACVCFKITKPSGVDVTSMGLYLYSEDGTLLTSKAFKVSNVKKTTQTFHTWFDMKDEIGYGLEPGTTYKYRMYGIFDGEQVLSEMKSFTTKS